MSLNPIDRDALYVFAQNLGKNVEIVGADTTVTLPTGAVLSGDAVNAILDVAGPHPAGTDRKISFRISGPFILPHGD